MRGFSRVYLNAKLMRNILKLHDAEGNELRVDVMPDGSRRIEVEYSDGDRAIIELDREDARKLAHALNIK